MGFNTDDIVPINQARAAFTELAEEVRASKEKIITRHGESCGALVDARRPDHYHRLEREHIHLTLLEEALKGLADVDAERTSSAAETLVKGSEQMPGASAERACFAPLLNRRRWVASSVTLPGETLRFTCWQSDTVASCRSTYVRTGHDLPQMKNWTRQRL